jgi:hypothetical protein
MGALPIPATMDEVDSAWLTAALRAAGVIHDATVIASPRVQIGQGVGILGELARVTLEYDRPEPGAPASLIAKLPTADPGGRGVAQMLGFYEKEARFYRDLAHRVGVRTARGYYADADPANVRYVILMEDLSAFTLGDQVAGATAEECEALVAELAALHARWWECADLHALEWVPPANSETVKLAAVAYAQAIQPFLANFGGELDDEARQWALDFMHRMNPIQDAFSSAPATLLHGDLRLDNVFWDRSDGAPRVALVDWQIAVKGRGPYDLAYFMSQSVDPAIRAAHEEALVRDYHRRLCEAGVSGYAFDQCWEDYRVSIMFCLAYPVVACGTVDLANERGLELARKMLHRSLAAIRDLEAHRLLERFEPRPHPLLAG